MTNSVTDKWSNLLLGQTEPTFINLYFCYGLSALGVKKLSFTTEVFLFSKSQKK